MRKNFLFFAVLVLTSALASASFELDNLSITSNYGPGETIKGWVNISLQDESSTSALSAFDSEINIIDFLKNNSLNSDTGFSCFPVDCKTNYKESNKEINKTYTLNAGDRKIFGLRITGEISSIDSFSFNIQSIAPESSYPQLFIDVLNDNTIDWQAHNFSGTYGGTIYNCYSREQATQIAEITQTEYCQKIEIPSASRIKTGAEIVAMPSKGGNVKFIMRVYNNEGGDFGTCTVSATGAGNISCEINKSVEKKQDFFVCISTEKYEDNNKYGMYYEQNSPCGFSENNDEVYSYDFPIFVQPGKFRPIGNVSLNQNEMDSYKGTGVINLAEDIEDYIIDRYDNNCSNGCIIPIKIIAGEQQTLTILGGQLGYTSGISTTERYFYDISEEPAKINMGFKILNLEKSDIKVPSTYGKKVMSLKLGGTEIVSRNIEVLKLATIGGVYPLEVAAAVPAKFYVSATGNITEYKWNFGDGTEIKTKENFTSHTYAAIGTYKLKISALNPQGEATKEFDILARSPKDEINRTLKEKRASLNNITAKINGIVGWYKPEIEKEINVSNLKEELDVIQRRYETSDDYVEIMKALLEINIPSGLESVSFKGEFLPFPESIDPSYLPDYKEEDSQQYPDRIVIWMVQNLGLNIESEIFYLKNQGESEPILTAFTLKIVPKEEIEEAFLIIEGEGIKFKEDYDQEELDGAMKIDLSGLEGEKIIGFVIPRKIEAVDLPLYISPSISKLPGGVDPGPCDNDGKCEKDNEEDKENCPNDCHEINWLRTLIFLGILLFCTFVVYIILQEWYKRYYERHLFKDKNDLYNLMSFIFNALRQGKDKNEIYKTLKQYKWKNEQIVYAFKKLLGKRTGMWEIPLFSAFEKKKVRQELAKRGQVYSSKIVQ